MKAGEDGFEILKITRCGLQIRTNEGIIVFVRHFPAIRMAGYQCLMPMASLVFYCFLPNFNCKMGCGNSVLVLVIDVLLSLYQATKRGVRVFSFVTQVIRFISECSS